MNRIPLAVGLGLLSLFVFILGAEPFEGKNDVMAVVSGSFLLAVYLGICAYWMLHKPGEDAASPREIVLSLLVPMVAEAIVVLIFEHAATFLAQGVPMLCAGTAGCFLGVWAAIHHPRHMPPHTP